MATEAATKTVTATKTATATTRTVTATNTATGDRRLEIIEADDGDGHENGYDYEEPCGPCRVPEAFALALVG